MLHHRPVGGGGRYFDDEVQMPSNLKSTFAPLQKKISKLWKRKPVFVLVGVTLLAVLCVTIVLSMVMNFETTHAMPVPSHVFAESPRSESSPSTIHMSHQELAKKYHEDESHVNEEVKRVKELHDAHYDSSSSNTPELEFLRDQNLKYKTATEHLESVLSDLEADVHYYESELTMADKRIAELEQQLSAERTKIKATEDDGKQNSDLSPTCTGNGQKGESELLAQALLEVRHALEDCASSQGLQMRQLPLHKNAQWSEGDLRKIAEVHRSKNAEAGTSLYDHTHHATPQRHVPHRSAGGWIPSGNY